MGLLGSLVLDTGQRWGACATEAQRADALAILRMTDLAGTGSVGAAGTPRPPTSPRSSSSCCSCCRSARSGSGGGGPRPGGDPGAADARAPDPHGPHAGEFEVTNRRVTCKRTGSFVEVLPADGSSAWGLSPAVVVLDEFPQWRDTENARELYDALVTALPKTPGSRLIIMGTAGDPAGWAAKVREQALADPENWRVSEPLGPPPWMSAADVELERRHRLPSIFARLFGNLWTAPENRLTSMEDLRAAVRLDGPQDYKPGIRYKIGVDLGLRNDRTAIAVCHAETVEGQERQARRPRPHDRLRGDQGQRGDLGRGGRDAVRDVAHVRPSSHQARPVAGHRPRPAVAHPAASTSRSGSYSDRRYGAAAGALFGLLRDGLLDLYDHPALLDELATVRLRETSLPGVVRVDHDAGRHDDMVQALGFAVTALLEKPGGVATFEVVQGDLRAPAVDRHHYYRRTSRPSRASRRAKCARPTSCWSFRNARRHPKFQGPGSRWR